MEGASDGRLNLTLLDIVRAVSQPHIIRQIAGVLLEATRKGGGRGGAGGEGAGRGAGEDMRD
jgi:hypothetical protein